MACGTPRSWLALARAARGRHAGLVLDPTTLASGPRRSSPSRRNATCRARLSVAALKAAASSGNRALEG